MSGIPGKISVSISSVDIIQNSLTWMINLPRSERDVSVLFKELRHRDQLGQSVPESLAVRVVIAPDGVGPPACQERAAAGTTESHLGEGVGEDQAPGGQTVQVWGHHGGRTEVTALTQCTNVRSDNCQCLVVSLTSHRHT